MAITRFQDVTQAAIEAYLGSLTAPAFAYRNFFPAEFTSSLSWESIEGTGNASVSADVMAHDSSARLKSRPDATMATGKIYKVGILNRVSETALHNLYALVNNPRGQEAQIYRIIFGDIERSYTGVHQRFEHLAMQALSTGVAQTTASDNRGITVTATYNIPSANKVGAQGAIWSTAASCTPIEDLRHVVNLAKSKGLRVTRILMNEASFNQLRNADSVKALYSGLMGLNSGILAPNVDNINVVLRADLLPPIEIVDSSVTVENADGSYTTIDPWSAGKVTFLTQPVAGSLMYTLTAEEKSFEGTAQGVLAANRDVVRITRWSEHNPFRVFTKGEAVAFPVLQNVSGIFMLNTLNATTWS